MTTTALVKRGTVEELVGHRNATIDAFKQSLDAFEATKAAWVRATGNDYFVSDFQHKERKLEKFIRRLDERCWKHLLHMTSLASLMDVRARKKFDDQCETAPPEVTVDNVIATMTSLIGDADNIFRRSVVAVFESLPREYRSNDGFKYGRRIVMSHMLSTDRGSWNFCGSRSVDGQAIHDMDRVFSVLDDKEPPGFLQPGSALKAIDEACRTATRQFEVTSQYFRIKGFKNGNLHVMPLREDLLVAANKMLAAHYGWVLPDSRAR